MGVLSTSGREYPQHPIPGVGAIVVGRPGVLLVRRDKFPDAGLWSFPGGGVELGETMEEAVVREVFEETGVLCRPVQYAGSADLIFSDGAGRVQYHFVLNHYIAVALTEHTRPESAKAEVAWFPHVQLPRDEMPPLVAHLLDYHLPRITEVVRRHSHTRRPAP